MIVKKLLFFFLVSFLLINQNTLAELSKDSTAGMNTVYSGVINRWDGYQINNIVVEVSQTVIGEHDNNDKNTEKDFVVLKIYEWKEDKWNLEKTITIHFNSEKTVKIKNDIYLIQINKIVDKLNDCYVDLNIQSNIDTIYTKNIVLGGHDNTIGYGNPEIKIIKEISSNIINLDDVITVTISVENIGKYDAYNIVIQDQQQPYFALIDLLVNENNIEVLKPLEKRIISIYKLQPIQEGIFEIIPASATYLNKEKQLFSASNDRILKVHVLESIINKPKIIIVNEIKKNEIRSYTESLKIKLKVINEGNETAKNIKIKLIAPKEINLKSNDFNDNIIFIRELLSNGEKVYKYEIKCNDIGNYEINTQYSYSYDHMNKCKTECGSIDSYNLIVKKSIVWLLFKKISPTVYLFFVSILFIIISCFWKKYSEYKY